jgi:hypothetical protein
VSPVTLDHIIFNVKAPDTTAGSTDLTTEGGFSDICKGICVCSTVRSLSTSSEAAAERRRFEESAIDCVIIRAGRVYSTNGQPALITVAVRIVRRTGIAGDTFCILCSEAGEPYIDLQVPCNAVTLGINCRERERVHTIGICLGGSNDLCWITGTVDQVDLNAIDTGFYNVLAAVAIKIIPDEVANGDLAFFPVWITDVNRVTYSSFITARLCARIAVIGTIGL